MKEDEQNQEKLKASIITGYKILSLEKTMMFISYFSEGQED